MPIKHAYIIWSCGQENIALYWLLVILQKTAEWRMAITIPAKQCYTVYVYIYAQQNPLLKKTKKKNYK